MKIGLFHGSLPQPDRKPGGVDIVVHQLANALTKKHEDVTVISFSPRPSDALYHHRHLSPGLGWLRKSKILRLHGSSIAMNVSNIADNLDVLHLHGDDWFYFVRTCPTVRTIHGSALSEARTATSWRRKISQRVIYQLERLSTRLATVSLGVGPETVKLYQADRLIDNGVDAERFHPGAKADNPRILFVGTWLGRKRGKFIYEQFINVIRNEVPNSELYMVCDYCPGGPGIFHIDLPDEANLANLFRSAWVFAYPSLYEGYGLAYLEAMASGTAVVASPNQGAAYVLQHGRLGHIVDDDLFSSAVVHLLTDNFDRQHLETAGRAVAQRFTWDQLADVHCAIYQSAINRWTEE